MSQTVIARSTNLNAQYTAFVVFFDVDGQMEVWPYLDFVEACRTAVRKQEYMDDNGYDYGHYRALNKLPRKTIYKLHPAVGYLREDVKS